MEDFAPLLFIIPIMTLVGYAIVWTFRRSRQMLTDWAARNEIELLDAQFRWLWRGPFFWSSSKNQTIYRITVMDADGRTRTGWAKCGSFWLGLFRDQVEVRWDD